MAEIKAADINASMWPFFDNGLLLKITDFYLEKNVYEKRKLLEQKLKILSCTMMNSNARSVYKELYNHETYPACTIFLTFPIAYDEHLKKLNEKKSVLEKELEKMLTFLRSQEMAAMLKEEKLFNMAYVKSHFSLEEKQLEVLFEYAKFLYECGSYSGTYHHVSQAY